jgi:hypothetical protein
MQISDFSQRQKQRFQITALNALADISWRRQFGRITFISEADVLTSP